MFNKSVAILFTVLLIPVLAACAGSAQASSTEPGTEPAETTSAAIATTVPPRVQALEPTEPLCGVEDLPHNAKMHEGPYSNPPIRLR